MNPIPSHLHLICESIGVLLLDVDGVLTDGSLVYGSQHEELKTFNVRDGLGIRLALEAGIRVGIVTGRGGAALDRRCRELGITLVFEKIKNKASILDQILTQHAVGGAEVAFVGDDLIDLPLLKRVGLPIAVADAHPEVRRVAAWVTRAPGGKGAVREVCEGLLSAQGHWDGILRKYNL